MKKLMILAAAAALVAGVALTPAPALALGENLSGNVEDVLSNPFGCDTARGGTACNLYQRYYGDLDPTIVNGPAAVVNGYPGYKNFPDRYLGDNQLTSNFPGISADNDSCEAWYSVWSGVVGPETSTFLTYYAAQATLVNIGETGDATAADCTGTGLQACFGAVSNASSSDNSINTPLGAAAQARIGGLEVVPIPRVTLNPSPAPGTLSIAFDAAGNSTIDNRPSATGNTCPAGSSFDDINQTGNVPAINPIWGVRLYVHAIANAPQPGPFRTLASLEGSPNPTAAVLASLDNATQNTLGCAGAGGGADCPGVHLVSCSSVSGASCVVGDPDSFQAGAQAFDVTRAAVDAALATDGPLSAANNAVFNTKVLFRGSVAGSHAGSRAASAQVNPGMMSLFSANSTRISFDSLVSRLQFSRTPSILGNRVTLDWNTVGDFTEFQLQRAGDGISFEPVATIPANELSVYQYTDTLRGRSGGNNLTYRLIGIDAQGVESMILTQVEIMPTVRPNPRRR